MYGGIDTTVKPDGRDLKDALAEAVQNLPQNFYQNPETSPAEEEAAEVDYNVKPLCYKADNGRLYMRMGDEMVEQAIPKSPKDAYQRIQGMIGLREELHHILDIQIQGCSDEVLKKEQAKLNAQYDLFVRRYGNLNRRIYYELHRRNYLRYHRMRGTLWLRKKKRLSVVLVEITRFATKRKGSRRQSNLTLVFREVCTMKSVPF